MCGVELENRRDKQSKLFYLEVSFSADLQSVFHLCPTREFSDRSSEEQHPLVHVKGKTVIPALRAEWRHVYSHIIGMLW